MLEPAVRPGQKPQSSLPSSHAAAAPRDAAAAFENKSFEELFRELSDTPPADTPANETPVGETERSEPGDGVRTAPRPGPTDPLAPLHTIENASLRRLLADRPNPSTDTDFEHNRSA